MFARGCPFPCVWNASSGSLPWGPGATAGKRGSVWGRWGSEPGSELRWLSLQPACWLEYSRDRTGLGQGGAESEPDCGQRQMLVPAPSALCFTLSVRDCHLRCVHARPWDRVSTDAVGRRRARGREGVRGTARTGGWGCGIWRASKLWCCPRVNGKIPRSGGEGARACVPLSQLCELGHDSKSGCASVSLWVRCK